MKMNFRYLLTCLSAICMIQMDGWSQISILQDYQNRTSPTIGTFQGINFREAGFSGLCAIPNTNGKEFWVVSDRGVNVDAASANLPECRPTYDKIYGFPSYAPKIHRIRLAGDSIHILKTITIKRPGGATATGIINPTGFGSTAAEIASTDTVQNCANFNSKIASKDIWGIDSEGIAVDKDGNFWLCEEGGPTIWKLNPNGVVIKRFTPYANLAGAQPQDVQIDTVFKHRKNNRGFEGIAITPNGKVYAMIQSPILYPTAAVGNDSRIHRMIEIDPVTNTSRMFAYVNDGVIGAAGANQIRTSDWKIGDMAAINDHEFLVIEAAARGTSDFKRIYKINIANATAINSSFYMYWTAEGLVTSTTNRLAEVNVTAVSKVLFMDLLANGWPAALDKAEGLTILNDSTLVIGNDNDYGQASPTANGVATATGNVSHILTYRLQGANKLTNFKPAYPLLSIGGTAPSSSSTPYMYSTVEGGYFTSILTAGDTTSNGYKMAGIPDGAGAFDNNDGTFTMLVNHEIPDGLGAVRAHGQPGAFVSKWIINKSDLSVVSGSDLIQNVNVWGGTTVGYTSYNVGNPSALALFGRFCSADLPAVSAYYNSATGNGTQERIFMNGEELDNADGRAFGHIVTGAEAGTSYELPRHGKYAIENLVACPVASDKTIVAGFDDSTPGQVYVYIGTKMNTGSDVDKAGLTNGKLFGVKVDGYLSESNANMPAAGTAFSLFDLGNVEDSTKAELNDMSNANGVTTFIRPEDGAWDPTHPSDLYFVTTNSFSGPSRLWKLHFTDILNPELGGTITAVLDGTEGQKMMDNIGIDAYGHIMIQEDVGNQAHLGKMWQYNIAADKLTLVATHDSERFINGAPQFLTQDEESSGIIDAQEILGPGMFLLVDQSHHSIPGEIYQGGQILAYFNPDTYNAVGTKGPSTAETPYLQPTTPGARFTSILAAGEEVNGYKMVGIPDGTGAFDNGDGTFTFLVNHELRTTHGVTRAHGQIGAFVSKWKIKKSDLSVVSGEDLVQNVNVWNGTGYDMYNASNPNVLSMFGRLCSADLPAPSAYYNPATGLGTTERLFMNGEENGVEGRAFAHIVTGTNAGTSYELPHLGKLNYENVVASPFSGDSTVVIGLDDATPGQVYVYIGKKTNTGTEIEKAGLTNGKLCGVAVAGLLAETTTVPAPGTVFTLPSLGSVENTTGATIQTNSNNLGITNFLRPEDGAWDPTHPNDFYFVTTANFTDPSRLWRLRFTDIKQPSLGGTIEAVLDGTEGQINLDNMTVDNNGFVILQEDVGNNAHIGKMWQYTPATDKFEMIAQHDHKRFLNGAPEFLTQDEEASGIIDAQEILGPGMFLLVDQSHHLIPGEIVEGGQLLAFYNPTTRNANPAIAVRGNGSDILNGDNSPGIVDHTSFEFVGVNQSTTRSFLISNSGNGALVIDGISLEGTNANEFTLVDPITFPMTIAPNSFDTIKVSFVSVVAGTRTSTLVISSNDLINEYSVTLSCPVTDQITGPTSSTAPYMVPTVEEAEFTSILTVGDKVGDYTMCGIPDGAGAFDNGDGTFTMLVNHEIRVNEGAVRAHGQKGAFVSKWIINKSDLSVVSGSDLTQEVKIWNGAGYNTYNAANTHASAMFGRFCSADLPAVSAFYNPKTGLGTPERIFMNGEENGVEGRAFGHIVTGANAGTSYELPHLGKLNFETLVPAPYSGDSTVVIGLDDNTPGQVYVYIGKKTNTGTEIDKAGLTNGKLCGVAVSGLIAESNASVPTIGTVFTLPSLGSVENTTGAVIQTNSNNIGITTFLRPEDGAWDPLSPNDFYFATTASFSEPSRLWRLRFTDIKQPSLGGTIEAVLDGTEGQVNLDNLCVDLTGRALLQEDVGNNARNGRLYEYTIETDQLVQVGEHYSQLFLNTGTNFITQDEESSGIIDAQEILGPGMFLLTDQIHVAKVGELVEGGQLLAFFNPATAEANPEIALMDDAALEDGEATEFVTTPRGTVSKTLTIQNTGADKLVISDMYITGEHASEFTILNIPMYPLVIGANESEEVTVQFEATVNTARTANLIVSSNDITESSYDVELLGSVVTSTDKESTVAAHVKLYPNPAGDFATLAVKLTKKDQVFIRVFNAQGAEVLPSIRKNMESGDQQIVLNTAELKNGIYTVEVYTSDTNKSIKMNVVH